MARTSKIAMVNEINSEMLRDLLSEHGAPATMDRLVELVGGSCGGLADLGPSDMARVCNKIQRTLDAPAFQTEGRGSGRVWSYLSAAQRAEMDRKARDELDRADLVAQCLADLDPGSWSVSGDMVAMSTTDFLTRYAPSDTPDPAPEPTPDPEVATAPEVTPDPAPEVVPAPVKRSKGKSKGKPSKPAEPTQETTQETTPDPAPEPTVVNSVSF